MHVVVYTLSLPVYKNIESPHYYASVVAMFFVHFFSYGIIFSIVQYRSSHKTTYNLRTSLPARETRS